jgi:hypothetical protein
VPMTTEQMREHLARAEQHIAELKIARQRQLVDGLPLESGVRREAMQMLTVLEDSLPTLERHREFISKWLEDRAKSRHGFLIASPVSEDTRPRSKTSARRGGCVSRQLHRCAERSVHPNGLQG